MNREKSKAQLFVQGSFFLIVSNVCIKAINFFLLPLYTKNLTPSMLGVSDSITTFTDVLIPFLTLGLDSAYSAFYFDRKDPDRDKKVFSTLGIMFFLLGIIPIIMCAGASLISDRLFHSDSYRLEVFVALIGVSLTLWYRPFSLEVRLKNKMKLFGIASFAASLSMVLLNILFVSVLKLDEMALILSTTIVAGVALALFFMFSGGIPQRKYFDPVLLRKMFVFSIPLIPLVLMNWVLSLSDRYILLHYHGDAAVGLYGIGARFVILLNVIVSAISTAYTTFAFGSKDDEDAKKNYYLVFNVVSVFLILICFTAAVFGREIVAIMADEAYAGSYIVIRDLLYGQALYAMSTIVSYGIVFQKKSVFLLAATSAGAVVNFVCNLIFIPRYGLAAAALTTLIGYLLSLILTYFFSERLYPCDYGIVRVTVTVAATYAVSLVITDTNVITRVVVWGLAAVLCMVVYKDIVRVVIGFAKTLTRRD